MEIVLVSLVLTLSWFLHTGCTKLRLGIINRDIWTKVFKNGPSKICERQPLKKFKVIWSA